MLMCINNFYFPMKLLKVYLWQMSKVRVYDKIFQIVGYKDKVEKQYLIGGTSTIYT